MEPNQQQKKPKVKKGFKVFVGAVTVAILMGAVYYFAPGLRVSESKELETMKIDNENIDNVDKVAQLGLPTTIASTQALKNPLVRIVGYAWNGETPIIVANGGPRTTKGSLMEANGVNLEIVRQDMLTDIRAMLMKGVEQFHGGEKFPSSDKSAIGCMIMGDGVPFLIATMQSAMNKAFGKDKYHLQVVGCMGMSYGEDKLIGPPEWKTNPQSMLGSLISTVPGDGDWVVALNYAFANNLKVNPDFTTYDASAVNFFPAANDDYVEAAKILISSQNNGVTVDLKEVVSGKLTGKIVKRKIDGTSTWTPADKMVFDACSGLTDIVSTKEFNNQMATTLIVIKEWAEKNPKMVTDILKATLTASNQLKQHDEWARVGANAVANTFKLEDGNYWYSMFKGQSGSKNGISFNMGGTKALNYADVLQYYGVTGQNRYKSVYEQVSTYLTELNPFGFNESVEGIVPYELAVNLEFLKDVNDIETENAEKADYSKTNTDVLANGNWPINFATGSADIQSSSIANLTTVYNLLVQTEGSKISVVGHTDNTGSSSQNLLLSEKRAQAVVDFLLAKGLNIDRVQGIQGKGDTDPIADNGTSAGKSKNRRVQITFLK